MRFQPSLRSLALPLLLAGLAAMPALAGEPEWSILIANDTCPDYTWGDDEVTTRKSMAELVRSHLDEMTRTDAAAPENRDHYTMVTHEALHFLERYPERKDELVRRIREGRMMLSPNLCNSLWDFQGTESAIRNMYAARRLQREWGVPIDVMHHIEYPGLPWGVPALLSGSGVRWLTVSFYNIDSNFGELQCPPVFELESPDGSRVGVVMDGWASNKWAYFQGAELLKKPSSVTEDWLPHYRQLGAAFPARTILAAGTHSDTHPYCAEQTHGFAESIAALNAAPDRAAKFVNGTYAQFCRIMDETQQRTPFMATLRGSFGGCWDSWPASLGKCAADGRANERDFLAAETLVALASLHQPSLAAVTQAKRERAEWCWLMLADHAWNGTHLENYQENTRLRRAWNEEIFLLNKQIRAAAWTALGLTPAEGTLTLFNSLGLGREGLVRWETSSAATAVSAGGQSLPTQTVTEEGSNYVYFVAPPTPGFSFAQLQLAAAGSGATATTEAAVKATATELDGPFYRLKVDLATGGVASLIHKATGADLVVAGSRRGLCQTVFFDGKEHPLTDVTSVVDAAGPVFARLRIEGTTEGIRVTNFVTLYTQLDRVDFDVRIHKPVTTHEQRLVQFFPLRQQGGQLKAETTGAIIRPSKQPEGDLLPGADPTRCAVQGFIELSAAGAPTVTVAPLDAFLLQQDMDTLGFEVLGNDHDYKECFRDQGGMTDFRFRYVLRARAGGSDDAAAVAWSRAVATPLVAVAGAVDAKLPPRIAIDTTHAVPLCLKPADDPAEKGLVLRVWETGGKSGDLAVAVTGFQSAVRTDLLERDVTQLPIADGQVALPIRARGFASLRLVP